jgi:hypothetical protein
VFEVVGVHLQRYDGAASLAQEVRSPANCDYTDTPESRPDFCHSVVGNLTTGSCGRSVCLGLGPLGPVAIDIRLGRQRGNAGKVSGTKGNLGQKNIQDTHMGKEFPQQEEVAKTEFSAYPFSRRAATHWMERYPRAQT